MHGSHNAIGVDVGTESVKAVALELARGATTPHVLSATAALSSGVRKGIVVDSEKLSASIAETVKNLFASMGVSSGSVYVACGGLGVGYQKAKGLIAISRADGEVSSEDMRRAVAASETSLSRLQNKDILHTIPLLYTVDGEPPTQAPLGLSGLKLEAETLFVTAQSTQVKALLKSFEEAGVDIEGVGAGSLMLSRAVLNPREKEVGVATIDIGAATTSITLFEEGLPYSLEILPIGSMHITQDIAVGFQVDLDEAEKIKLNFRPLSGKSSNKKEDLMYGQYSRKKCEEIISMRLEDIFELIEKHLKKVDRAGLLPGGVVLAGGGANFPGIADEAKEFLKLPARVAYPMHVEGAKEKVKNPAWATAVGAALFALENSRGSLMRGGSGAFLRWLKAFLP